MIAFSENSLLHEYKLLNKSTARTTSKLEFRNDISNIISILPLHAKTSLSRKEMAKYYKRSNPQEKPCSGSQVRRLLTWTCKCQRTPTPDLGRCEALHNISVRSLDKTVLTYPNIAFNSCLSESICCYTHIRFFPNSPIFFGRILQHNITGDVNWNLVKCKNLKPHKSQRSYWDRNYLAAFIYSCKQLNLTSNGSVAGLNYLTSPNMDFCCSILLPNVPISKPTAMAISSRRHAYPAKRGRELSILPQTQFTWQ